MKKGLKVLSLTAAILLALSHVHFTQEGDSVSGVRTGTRIPGNSLKYRGIVVGDIDNDGIEEMACDFGTAGIWLYDWNHSPRWVKIRNEDPDSMIALDFEGDGEVDFLAAYTAGDGKMELWDWQSGNQAGTWTNFSAAWYPQWMTAANVDGDNDDEVIVQLISSSAGQPKLWLTDDLDGWNLIFDGNTVGGFAVQFAAADDELVVQVLGGNLQWWNFSSWGDTDMTDQWEIMSTSVCDIIDCRAGNVDGDTEEEFVGDFVGGLWVYNYSSTPRWAKINNAGVGDIHIEDIVNDGKAEIIPDYSTTWYYEWGAGWTKISGNSPEADGWVESTDNGLLDGTTKEIVVDYGALGLWLWDASSTPKWRKLTPSDPQVMVEINYDGGSATEFVVDFGSGGLWIYDPGVSPNWRRITTSDVEQN